MSGCPSSLTKAKAEVTQILSVFCTDLRMHGSTDQRNKGSTDVEKERFGDKEM